MIKNRYMDLQCSDGNQTNIIRLGVTLLLGMIGRLAGYIQTNSAEIEAIKFIIQCLAWGSAIIVMIITVLKFLHDHDWINLKRKKQKIKK